MGVPPEYYARALRGRTISNWFLLGTGRMPHPVGGGIGATCVIGVMCHWRDVSLA